MSERQRDSLLDYARFLNQQADEHVPESDREKQQPLDHPRPEQENVVNAIKRLRASYFMLNADELLNEASALMAQFVVQGRPAAEVIDDLEDLFSDHYRKYLDD